MGNTQCHIRGNQPPDTVSCNFVEQEKRVEFFPPWGNTDRQFLHTCKAALFLFERSIAGRFITVVFKFVSRVSCDN